MLAKIRAHGDEDGFPMVGDYDLSADWIDDYLFEKQAIIDAKGSLRTQYTIIGFLMVIPILVLSAFPDEQLPWGKWSILAALAAGLVLVAIYYAIAKIVEKVRLKHLCDDRAERYLQAVEQY